MEHSAASYWGDSLLGLPGSGLAGWLRLASSPGAFEITCSITYRVALAQALYGTFRGPAVSDALSPPLSGKARPYRCCRLVLSAPKVGLCGRLAVCQTYQKPLGVPASWGSVC